MNANILKVAHHGSKSSSGEKFLQCVKPQVALIGVGENNNFGHPNAIVLERIKKVGTSVYRTDLCGEIIIEVDQNSNYYIHTHIK